MKAAILVLLLLVATMPAWAGISDARKLLEQGEVGKAAELLAEMLKEKPNDPWLLYNAGVTAYAAKDYAKADALWQQLATMPLPEELQEQVWMQIGNASFRLAEAASERQPDVALAKIEQSREAYRVAIAQNPEGKIAPKNLQFVEKELELLNVRLSERLIAGAEAEKAHERAIEKLHAALGYQRNATALNPKEPRHAKAEREIQRLLADRFLKKAGDAEKRGDRIAEQKVLDQGKLKDARKEFEKAIADFKQAKVFDADRPESKEGEQRVTDKLANMFAKAGRQEQRAGNAEAKQNAGQALESYEKALQYFDDALAIKADHKDAKAGQQEVKSAMEKLHLQQGDKLTKEGEGQIKKNPSEAVGNLFGALAHFEQAKALNPDNPEIPPRIEHVRKLLPEALVSLGKRQQQRAEEAEPESIPNAIAHLEQAEATYEKALELAPEHAEAKQGLKEVQEDLARLRKLLTQEEPQPPKQQQTSQQQQQQQQKPQSFEEMLAEVKAKQEKREAQTQRSVEVKYDPANTSGLRNW